jgi:hypothetical protein
VVTASPHCNDAVEWLPDTGAIMFAVEHRYYGCHNMSACPVASFSSLDDLRFLSSAQALEDLALFIAHATAAYNLTGCQWVAWGGRYLSTFCMRCDTSAEAHELLTPTAAIRVCLQAGCV